MEHTGLAILVAGYLAYALVSRRVARWPVTAPMVFVGIGFLIGPAGSGILGLPVGHGFLHAIAEITLVLILFADAARIELRLVRLDHNLPVRMLLVGLPLAIGLGSAIGAVLFPGFGLWEVALLAALLAPTDAALGQAVVSNASVPVRIRQAINIESGLNDGIALPAVLLFAALASATAAAESSEWLRFGLMQVTLGPIVGVVVGYLGCRLIDFAADRRWMASTYEGMAILALAGLCYLVAEIAGGNGFIAAFVGGMTFGNCIKNKCEFLFEFMETEGQILMLVTFLLFGLVLLPEGLAHFEWVYLLYAALSLTVIRMLPIAVSLLGAGVRLPTIGFLGWFGPRGLASILFVLLILEEADVEHAHEILSVTVLTVALSTLLHGLTASPLAAAYARSVARMGECEEMRPVSDMPLREGMLPTTRKDLHE